MFGIKMFSKTKTQKFATDKDRKQYYAIQGYYKEKNQSVKSDALKSKKGKYRK